MVRPQDLLLDRQGPTVELFGLSGLPFRLTDRGEVVEVHRQLVVLRPVNPLEDGQRLRIQRLRLVEAPLGVQDRRQGGLVGGHGGMIGADGPLPDLDRPPRPGLPLGGPAAGVLEPAEIVVERCDVRMLGAERRLDDRQRPPVDRLGVVVPPLIFVEHSEPVEEAGRLEVLREGGLGDRQGAPVEPLRRRITPLGLADVGEHPH